jgi:hypothetical protein
MLGSHIFKAVTDCFHKNYNMLSPEVFNFTKTLCILDRCLYPRYSVRVDIQIALKARVEKEFQPSFHLL